MRKILLKNIINHSNKNFQTLIKEYKNGSTRKTKEEETNCSSKTLSIIKFQKSLKKISH
jgi:hypothetical protein